MESTVKPIRGVVKVRNAYLYEDALYYYVTHYETIILKVNKQNQAVEIILPVSASSQRAISQAFNYIKVPGTMETLTKAVNGKTIKELKKEWKDELYRMSTPINYTQAQAKIFVQIASNGGAQ